MAKTTVITGAAAGRATGIAFEKAASRHRNALRAAIGTAAASGSRSQLASRTRHHHEKERAWRITT